MHSEILAFVLKLAELCQYDSAPSPVNSAPCYYCFQQTNQFIWSPLGSPTVIFGAVSNAQGQNSLPWDCPLIKKGVVERKTLVEVQDLLFSVFPNKVQGCFSPLCSTSVCCKKRGTSYQDTTADEPQGCCPQAADPKEARMAVKTLQLSHLHLQSSGRKNEGMEKRATVFI